MEIVYYGETWFWVNGNVSLLTLRPEYSVLIKKQGHSKSVKIKDLKASAN